LQVEESIVQVHFRIFSSGKMLSTPEGVLRDASEQAAEFASSLPPDSLVGISQAFAQHNMAYVTVWYRRGLGDANSADPAEAASEIDETEVQEWLEQPDAET
jgi:hypothetical protein